MKITSNYVKSRDSLWMAHIHGTHNGKASRTQCQSHFQEYFKHFLWINRLDLDFWAFICVQTEYYKFHRKIVCQKKKSK